MKFKINSLNTETANFFIANVNFIDGEEPPFTRDIQISLRNDELANKDSIILKLIASIGLSEIGEQFKSDESAINTVIAENGDIEYHV